MELRTDMVFTKLNENSRMLLAVFHTIVRVERPIFPDTESKTENTL